MKKVCVVMGVGPGNGEAFVRRFSDQGFQVAMLARSEDYLKQLEQSITGARAFVCDLMEPGQITSVLAAIESELGMLSDKPDDFFVQPSAVADAVWNLSQQDPSAWTFELDIRPFGENW